MSATPGEAAVSPARLVAYRVIRRVFEQGAYADRALRAQGEGLPPRDLALATQLVFGTVQRRATLDHVIRALAERPLGRLDPAVLAGLRLGLYQLLFLDRVAAHAAVGESVELVKLGHRRGGGLVNAVLRRAAREGPQLLAGLDDRDPASAAVCHSVPQWLAELWWRELGPPAARALLAAVNRPAETAVRVNTLRADPLAVPADLPVPAAPAPGLPEGLILGGAFDAHGSQLFAAGAIMPQSRGSMLVARALAPEPGERVLDLCAAPGGKTTHLAALMRDEGEIVAIERHAGRAGALRRTCQRMGVGCVQVREADATQLPPAPGFQRVLVDPPCSGLGTLQSRPDLRWRANPDAIAEMAAAQAQILRSGAAATAPGGVLVYSVCTISAAEGAEVVERFLEQEPGWSPDKVQAPWPRPPAAAWPRPYLQLRADLDGTDGFFIARLRRAL